MDKLSRGFDLLPVEIKQLIFSFTDLNLTTVLRVQSVSSEFKTLCWSWIRTIDVLIPTKLFNRFNINSIRAINCKKWPDPVMLVLPMLKLLPNIEIIYFDFEQGSLTDESTLTRNLPEFEQYPKLRQIDYNNGLWIRGGSNFQFNQARNHIFQQDPFTLDKTKMYNRGGTIGPSLWSQNMLVIGATDGTLTFLTLSEDISDRKAVLKIHSSTNEIHKDSITAIWSENVNVTYIASNDGVVSSWTYASSDGWSSSQKQLELKQTLTFPESIFFVCDHACKYLLAAGKRTLYIADIETNQILTKITLDDDVTGLFGTVQDAFLSTKNALYTVNKDLTGVEVVQKNVPYPNLWLNSDASLWIVVHPGRVEVTNSTINITHSFTLDQCDTRPHLARLSPKTSSIMVSSGTNLVYYSLRYLRSAFEITPKNGASSVDHPPPCNAFWYSPDGNFLFSLHSNNTLCWWHSPLTSF